MKTNTVIVILFLAAVSAGAYEQAGDAKNLNRRAIAATLYLSNPYDGGDWGPVATCSLGSFVHSFEILYYHEGWLGDATAINSVKLYCKTRESLDTGYIISGGPDGDWLGMRLCNGTFMTGFRADVMPYQGIFSDDEAVNDFEGECNYGSEILPGLRTKKETKKDNWSAWTQCPPNTAVCGLQTRVDGSGALEDNIAIADINLFCCVLHKRPATTPLP